MRALANQQDQGDHGGMVSLRTGGTVPLPPWQGCSSGKLGTASMLCQAEDDVGPEWVPAACPGSRE